MRKLFCFLLILLAGLAPVRALDGTIGIHDPSTVIQCEGKYYVYGTGRGIPFLISSNGFDWERGGHVFEQVPDSVHSYVPKNNGTGVWAPDIIHVGGQYYLYYAISSWGQFVSAVGLEASPTLDTNRPDYKWTDRGMVVHSSEGEALNAIDPGVCLAPDGTLWMCYGSYHGNIELVELDPKTGLRVSTNAPVSIIADHSEASDIIHHGNYFYLFVNHGSCCQGTNSTYNIRVGRAEKITGPYLDRDGDNLLGGGGTLFLEAGGLDIGPGHFGLLLDDGVEKFSCHFEGVVGSAGRSILEIRPLIWTLDGWPQAGDNLADGTYQFLSLRTGTVLQVTGTNEIVVQTSRYLARDYQRWLVTPAGGGFYKIINARGGDALTVKSDEVRMEAFAGADTQLWKIDQMLDGTYRVESKIDKMALTTLGKKDSGEGVALQSFDGAETQRWVISAP